MESYILCKGILVNFLDCVALEWSLTAEKEVGDAAQGPDVDFVGVAGYPLHKLWRHVKRRPKNERHALFSLEFLSKSKINQF